LGHLGYIREIEVPKLWIGEMFALSGLDKETQQPVVETHAEKKQMRIMERCREVAGSMQVLIEGAEESESVVVPQGTVWCFANLAEEMIHACKRQIAGVGRKIPEPLT